MKTKPKNNETIPIRIAKALVKEIRIEAIQNNRTLRAQLEEDLKKYFKSLQAQS